MLAKQIIKSSIGKYKIHFDIKEGRTTQFHGHISQDGRLELAKSNK